MTSLATSGNLPGSTGNPQHLVLMGVAGSGKTSVAALLSEHLDWASAEADAFHSEANIAKMSSGLPLEDADRWPWLDDIREWMSAQARTGKSTIVTCSALKRTYRDILSTAHGYVLFIHLDGSPEMLRQRMEARAGHFMPESLLPSQLATLERLGPDEQGVTIDISPSQAHIAALILDSIRAPAAD
jgi:gluconokinase